MTVSFENVKVGDRIRLTASNGDLAEFTVHDVDDSGAYNRYYDYFDNTDGWVMLEILPKPLPSAPGLYVKSDSEVEYYADIHALTDKGIWLSDESGEWAVLSEADVPRNLVRLVKEFDA